MTSLSYPLGNFPTICSSKKGHPQKHKLIGVSIVKPDRSFRSSSTAKVCQLNITQNGKVKYEGAERAENGSVMKMDLIQGVIFDGVKYRQTYIIRSTEVGPKKSATFESILNLIQETGLNHVSRIGICGDKYGATHEMISSNLVWVVTRMQVEVDYYPKWGEKIDVDTWYAPSTKNSVQRESLIQCSSTGIILARATSTWVLMNRTTRRLSKMSETMRTEISPWIIDKPMITRRNEKIEKLAIGGAKYFVSNLKPNSGDLDSNNHVNNVKYIRWILEAIPDRILQTHQLSTIVLEYRKECGSLDLVESLSEPYEYNDGVLRDECEDGQVSYTHLLHIKGGAKNDEILRGKTTWKNNIFDSK